jgi:hypothetical protein
VKSKNWAANLPDRKKTADGTLLPDPIYDAKYSSSTKGNMPFGSWNEDGLRFFNECVKEIQQSRDDDKKMAIIRGFEVAFLKYLQDKYEIGGAHGKKKSKKRKAGEDQPAPEEAAAVAMDVEQIDEDMFA